MTRAVLALLVASAMGQSQAPAPVPATMAQLMKGTLYPESNVVFAAQDTNPAEVQHAPDPSMATDPLASQYGKWEAVENNALAIAEVATLLSLPGRKCSNGLDVPVTNADWAKFVQGLRDAANDILRCGSSQGSGQDDRCRRCDDHRVRELPQKISREETGGSLQVGL